MAERATVVVPRTDAARVAEVQGVRAVTVRRSRPIGAAVADIEQTATTAGVITRSRIPDGRGRTELAGEVHAFVGAVVWIATKV